MENEALRKSSHLSVVDIEDLPQKRFGAIAVQMWGALRASGRPCEFVALQYEPFPAMSECLRHAGAGRLSIVIGVEKRHPDEA